MKFTWTLALSCTFSLFRHNRRKIHRVHFFLLLHLLFCTLKYCRYYESARCLHGRMAPLNGSYYVNLFTHYRPVGDPEWFRKENPSDGVRQLIDATGVDLSETRTRQPPDVVDLTGPLDLFKYWQLKTPVLEHMDPAKISPDL